MKDHVLTLKPTDLQLVAYIDVSFAPHPDLKWHTGVVIFVGGALVYLTSRKQKWVTKLPTKSELVALTNYIGLVKLFAEFIAFITNHLYKFLSFVKIPPLLLHLLPKAMV